MEINDIKALQTWGKTIEESTGIKDTTKIAWMSKVCAIQDNEDKKSPVYESAFWGPSLNPAMTMGGAGAIQFPTGGDNGFSGVRNGSGDAIASSVAIAMQVAAQTIALDFVAVVPIAAPQGQYRFYDTVYEGGRIDGDLKVGDSVKGFSDPVFVEVKGINGDDEAAAAAAETILRSVADETSESATYDDAAYDCHYNYVERVSTEGETIRLTFVEYGFISGKPIFLVERLDSAGHIINKRNFGGGMSLAEAFPMFSFDLVNTKENHITAFSGADLRKKTIQKGDSKNPYDNNFNTEPYDREEGEATTVNFLGAKRSSFDYKVKTLQIGFSATWEQIEDAQADGQDICAQLEADALNELSQSLNKDILTKMWELASVHADRLAARGEVLDTYFYSATETGAIPSAYANYSKVVVDNGGETSLTLQARITRKLLYAANIISHDSRLTGGKFIAIGSTQFVTAVQSVAGLTGITLPNNIQSVANAPTPVGQISNIGIYQDPNLPINYTGVLVARVNKASEPGLIYMPYIMAKKQTTTATATFAYAGAMKSRYALIAAGNYPDLQYVRMDLVMSDAVQLV